MSTLFLRLFVLMLALASSLSAALKIGTLNCFFLVDPARPAEGRLSGKAPQPEIYEAKVENLAGLITGLDVVGIQEVGSEREAGALASKAGYQVRFVQGKDTFTGQDVATLVAVRPGLVVRNASRVRELECLSKHLLVTVEESGTRYAILNVHLIRPIGKNAGKHGQQLAAISTWVAAVKAREPATVIVVLGDFNDPSPDLLPLADSAVATGFMPTHLDKKPFDRIFTTGVIEQAVVVRPPYPKRPNDTLKAEWSDHYLLKAMVEF
jgi:endonuclease/exonuclease/phosphatase family metal-dependent hydrolase